MKRYKTKPKKVKASAPKTGRRHLIFDITPLRHPAILYEEFEAALRPVLLRPALSESKKYFFIRKRSAFSFAALALLLLLVSAPLLLAFEAHVINVTAEIVMLDAPSISPPGGKYFTPELTITLSDADSDVTSIHYTLDGSDPSCASTLYVDPFLITLPTTVKAVGCDSTNLQQSLPVIADYFDPLPPPESSAPSGQSTPVEEPAAPVEEATSTPPIGPDNPSGDTATPEATSTLPIGSDTSNPGDTATTTPTTTPTPTATTTDTSQTLPPEPPTDTGTPAIEPPAPEPEAATPPPPAEPVGSDASSQ